MISLSAITTDKSISRLHVNDVSSSNNTNNKVTPNTTEKTTGKCSWESSQKSSQKSLQKSSQKILELIVVNTKISTQEMTDCIGLSRCAITKLQTEGILRRIGPGKGGYWEIK